MKFIRDVFTVLFNGFNAVNDYGTVAISIRDGDGTILVNRTVKFIDNGEVNQVDSSHLK